MIDLNSYVSVLSLWLLNDVTKQERQIFILLSSPSNNPSFFPFSVAAYNVLK